MVTATVAVALALGGPSVVASGATTPARVVARDLIAPRAWSTSAGLYLASTVAGGDELRRMDPSDGRVEASARLGGFVTDLVEAHGRVWLLESTGGATVLVARRAESLAPIAHRRVEEAADQLVAAGGRIWVANDTDLLRVDPATRAVERLPVPRGADVLDVATGESGGTLVTYVAPAGIQRRNPETGAPLASVNPEAAIAALSVYRHDLWTSVQAPAGGYVQVRHLQSLLTAGSEEPAAHAGTTDLAQVVGGTLFVTVVRASGRSSYCGNPTTGRLAATLTAASGRGELLAESGPDYFYVPDAAAGTVRLDEAVVPQGCT